MQRRALIAALLLLAGCSTVPRVGGPRLLPVDEASQDASLVAFRQRVLTAIRNRDEATLRAALDPHVRTSFGSAQDFVPHWNELESALSLGGTFQRTGEEARFWAPYVYSAWPEQFDAFAHLAVIAKDVPLRDAGKRVIALLSYDIVKRLPGAGHVATLDGREGWVDAKYLYSPVGYRAGLVRRRGTWKIEAFVNGD